MGNNTLSNKSLGMLAEGVAVNTGIEELSFTHNDLSLENGRNFINSLQNLYSLRKLSLNSCMIETSLFEALKESLRDTESLIALNLYSNDINAEGMQLISEMLVNKVNLRTLGLSNNIIGHGGARELANSLKHLK